MTVREVRAAGLEGLELATRLLQRARLAGPDVGIWEAADRQWWWRVPRRSDEIENVFWVDDDGPVAGVLLSAWGEHTWQCDPVVVPGAPGVDVEVVWARTLEHAAAHAPDGFDVPVDDGDATVVELARRSGLTPGDTDSTGWMDAGARPPSEAPADGFVVVDRTRRADAPHPFVPRSGEDVSQRLAQTSLYDPSLDLAAETTDGTVAGYALFWWDPTTAVGLVEPVRVEDDFQRRGLARALLTDGLDRLAARGARRLKVSWQSEAAGALYVGLGFVPTSTATWWRWSNPARE